METSAQLRLEPAPTIFVLEDEYDPLADVVCGSPRPTAGIALLWQELERARIIEPGRAPDNLVRMGCRVTVHDKVSDETFTVTLVYPTEAVRSGLVSVASSLGAALLGLPCGAEFHWQASGGRRRVIEILSVDPPPTRQSDQ